MINRNRAPEIQQIRQIEYLQAEKCILKNGMPVNYIHAANQEVVKIDFIFEAGAWQQRERFLASFTCYMLQEGSLNYSSQQIAEIFDFYGSYIQAGVDQHFAIISIISLNKYLPEILKVAEDILKRPTFPQHELDVLLEKHKQKFKQENEKVKVLCQKKFSTVMFGKDHPYSVNNRIEDFDAVNREKLLLFYQSWYHSGNCRIIVAGNANEEVRDLIEKYFGGDDWTAESQSVAIVEICSSLELMHKVTKANALQTAIRMGKPWVAKTHPDNHRLSVLITILGGYFGSRLMMNIREDKGYTYGIGAYVLNLKNAAYLMIATEVDNAYTEDTITEIKNEIVRLQEELVTDDELETVRSYLLGEFLRDFDGPFALASSFKSIDDFGLDYDFYDQYLAVLNQVTAAELQQLAKDYLTIDDMFTVVAGA